MRDELASLEDGSLLEHVQRRLGSSPIADAQFDPATTTQPEPEPEPEMESLRRAFQEAARRVRAHQRQRRRAIAEGFVGLLPGAGSLAPAMPMQVTAADLQHVTLAQLKRIAEARGVDCVVTIQAGTEGRGRVRVNFDKGQRQSVEGGELHVVATPAGGAGKRYVIEPQTAGLAFRTPTKDLMIKNKHAASAAPAFDVYPELRTRT
jgi:hypothetical protein